MSDVAIKFENISKQYRLGLVSTKTISHDLNRWWAVNVLRKEDPYLKIGEVNNRSTKGESEYVWALKDINFEVKQGDILGIIGKNGAGKSTLLKILSKVTEPTTGVISARGRIASLLEVGTGFHPEMTGRENIYMNGSIMGMRKAEITRKLDEIVDFAGVERYLDTPVKRYSSGMTVRLGFAIAAHLEPEILVVDEVLAVGDTEFQKKAIGKMQDVSKGEGRTVLFVSHNIASIRSLCNKGIVLENGCVSYFGDVNKSIDVYNRGAEVKVDSLIINSLQQISKAVQVKNVFVNDSPLSIINLKYPKRRMKIQVDLFTLLSLNVGIEFLLFDKNEVLLCKCAPSLKSGINTNAIVGYSSIIEEFHLPENITNGEYYLQIDITQPNIEYLASFPKGIKLITQDFMNENGMPFDYAACGLLFI